MTATQLKRLLDKHGWTQVGMARAISIGDRHMRRYISGEAEIPEHVAIAIRCLCEHTATNQREST